MSKIVCDVCGSSYSETEMQCPICGTAKSEAAKSAVETTGEEQANKAGKFSKTNNRKTGLGTVAKKSVQERNTSSDEENAPSNMAMIIIVGVLLIAIIAVCIFIAVRVFDNPDPTEPGSTPGTTSTAPTTLEIPCTGLELVGNADKTLSFAALTDSAQLNVNPLPENTTDVVTCTYTSSDPSVVLVDQTGLVTPVASGSATITISYGAHSITVNVTCDIPAPITELKLSRSEISFNPDTTTTWTWTLVASGLTGEGTSVELDASEIFWTSSDDTIVTVENGKVTAVGNGDATITASYGNFTATCKIIVRNMNMDTPYVVASRWSQKEATMTVGEKLEIYLLNQNTGEIVSGLTWEPSPDFQGGCASFVATEKGVEVTALKTTDNVSGKYVYIQTTYEGQVYKFIIRIKPAAGE